VTFPKENKDAIKDVYRLGEELGSGAFSVVVKATHKDSGETFAVKIVDKNSTGRKEMYDEISVMAQLEHANIVNFKEIFDRKDGYYVVLEFITGGELFDRIIELQRYSEKEAAHVMRQALHGLKHMHDKALAHRDLKPENLLLSSKDANATIKLADFGFSRKTTTGNDCHEMVGTPEYMAPELIAQRDRDAGYSKPVDIWAMGVVLYILLSGIHPFQMEDEEMMMNNIQAGRWRWLGSNWAKVSEAAKDLIQHMMEVNPATRFTVDQCLGHKWLREEQSDTELGGVAVEIRRFQAKKKMRAAIRAVMAANRMKNVVAKLRANAAAGGSAAGGWTAAQPKAGTKWKSFKVTVCEGHNLAAKDSNGKSDPYVKVIANGKTVHKTETKMKTLNPKYDPKKEIVTIPFTTALKFIDIEVWDWDRVGSDDFMGMHTIDLSEFPPGVEKEIDLKLEPATGSKSKKKKTENVSGYIKVKVFKTPDA